MPILGNHEKQIRPRSNQPPEEKVYDVEATAFRTFYALPGDEWKWRFDIPEFNVTFLALDLNHITDYGTTWQACHNFRQGSDQLVWYREQLQKKTSQYVITLQNEQNQRMRSQADGEWGRLFQQPTHVLTGYGYFSERAELNGITYYNSSLKAGDIYPDEYSKG